MPPIKASQTVYLNADKTKAVPEGDKDAKFLLVKEGQEINEEQAAKYEGAKELIGGTKKVAAHEKGHVQHRDPKSK